MWMLQSLVRRGGATIHIEKVFLRSIQPTSLGVMPAAFSLSSDLLGASACPSAQLCGAPAKLVCLEFVHDQLQSSRELILKLPLPGACTQSHEFATCELSATCKLYGNCKLTEGTTQYLLYIRGCTTTPTRVVAALAL